MTSQEIRSSFIAFFRKKQHQIVPSAPMVVKNDPTLMFINAGMNQFKDAFLGNTDPVAPRVADSQKCLRVSGKHNDLDEVGHDTYHHTMFEMLGNWSFGDYFKEEAIAWAWEFLHTEMGIPADRMYATVFGGDEGDKQPKDMEAYDFWKKWLPEERILDGNKKDNFWEMGETGPCGPCSEIHVDLRDDDERKKISGADLVNHDHPLVIEIWNLVFIQFNRNADTSLTPLPQKHVDTGMGFERLCMALQGKKSNYDTDVFQPIISEISRLSKLPYGKDEQKDIAMRVIADHLRAIAFAIADGQLPSNVKAGYVIRRILRRAVRYGYTFLDFKTPFINKLVPTLVNEMGGFFPELVKQQSLIEKVITEEELSFLRTLEQGINRLNQIVSDVKSQGYKMVKGSEAFELYDTFGFPFDLTELILRENELLVSKREFDEEMSKQKERSRQAAAQEAGDWIHVNEDDNSEVFVGYDQTEGDLFVTRYRAVKTNKETIYQLVFNYTPFYAESGGQAGDSGTLESDGEIVEITDTKKENNLFIHLTSELPSNPAALFHAKVDTKRRLAITNNHTATHLLHYALREVLGEHVEQKGSLVEADRFRFDFSHFQRLSEEEVVAVERLVNQKIRENISLDEHRNLPIIEAEKMGAMALFGEKYGDVVRVIRFGSSIELCGGTHAKATGQIGLFKIVSESAIAAGVRRIEAISAEGAEEYVTEKMDILKAVSSSFKNSKDVLKSIQKLQDESAQLQKEVATLKLAKAAGMKNEIKHSAKLINGINVIAVAPDLDAASVKDIAFQLRNEVENLFFIAGTVANEKPMLTIAVSDNLVADRAVHAGTIIRALAKEIKGGGGGQPHFATAGGKDPEGVQNALNKAVELIESLAE